MAYESGSTSSDAVDEGRREKTMEMDYKHIDKKLKSEAPGGTFETLPEDYNHWSSTVIIFKEKDNEITVYAVNCEDCVIYHVLSYQRDQWLYRKMGYTAGDFKLYFFGTIIFDSEDNPGNSQKVEVYDIRNRQWNTDVFPKLKAPKPKPFVFFLDSHLYVVSSALPSPPGEPHFEMLDINNISKGWEFGPEPDFVCKTIWARQHDDIIDYSQKMLYIRLLDDSLCGGCASYLHGYSLKDKQWHRYGNLSSLTPRLLNLLKASWSSASVIVEDYLYSFRIVTYQGGQRAGQRAVLIIRDLEHAIKVYDNSVEDDRLDEIHSDYDPLIEGILKVDISSIVTPNVLNDLYAVGYLVYLGKRNSCLRFCLFISYRCVSCRGDNHVYTCTFDLTQSSTNLCRIAEVAVCQPSCQHIDVGRGPIFCHKLCHEEDDNQEEHDILSRYLKDQVMKKTIIKRSMSF